MKRIATLLALSATISALAAATPSPLATQAWTAHEFFRAIQETGRTNVLTAADRQMISNYVDEVCHLYAVRMAPQEDEATFENGKLVYTVGDTVVTNSVSFGFRAYTNAGMRVVSSSLVEAPAGTLFAWDGANRRYVNASAAPYALAASWTYTETTGVVWRTTAAGRYATTNVSSSPTQTDRSSAPSRSSPRGSPTQTARPAWARRPHPRDARPLPSSPFFFQAPTRRPTTSRPRRLTRETSSSPSRSTAFSTKS